jgi:hypothetical protein
MAGDEKQPERLRDFQRDQEMVSAKQFINLFPL